MIVSDGTLEEMLLSGYLSVTPIEAGQVQPASIDVRLGADFIRFADGWGEFEVDPFKDNSDLGEPQTVRDGKCFLLRSGEFALGTTVESVRLPDDLVARVEGKSSLARIGLAVHATAGFIDPGFCGQVTLEFSNLSGHAIKLWPGMKIAQLSFQMMESVARRPYGHPELNSKYQDQKGTTAGQYHRN